MCSTPLARHTPHTVRSSQHVHANGLASQISKRSPSDLQALLAALLLPLACAPFSSANALHHRLSDAEQARFSLHPDAVCESSAESSRGVCESSAESALDVHASVAYPLIHAASGELLGVCQVLILLCKFIVYTYTHRFCLYIYLYWYALTYTSQRRAARRR